LRQGLATNLLTPLAAAAGIACVAPRFCGL